MRRLTRRAPPPFRCALHGVGENFDKLPFASTRKAAAAHPRGRLALIPADTEVARRAEAGGVPIATTMALESGLPAVFVRKAAKTYGTCRAVEGARGRGPQGVKRRRR